MSLDRRTLAPGVSVVGLVLLLAVQIASWRAHRRLSSGAFLLRIPILGPLFAGRPQDGT